MPGADEPQVLPIEMLEERNRAHRKHRPLWYSKPEVDVASGRLGVVLSQPPAIDMMLLVRADHYVQNALASRAWAESAFGSHLLVAKPQRPCSIATSTVNRTIDEYPPSYQGFLQPERPPTPPVVRSQPHSLNSAHRSAPSLRGPYLLLSRMTYLDRVLPWRELRPLLPLLGRDPARLAAGQALADGARLLGPQVEGQVTLLLVVEPQLVPLVGVDDGEDARDGLAEVVAVQALRQLPLCLSHAPSLEKEHVHAGELGRGAAGHFLGAHLDELGLELVELLSEVVLRLAPQGPRLDLGRCRLCRLLVSQCSFFWRFDKAHHGYREDRSDVVVIKALGSSNSQCAGCARVG